MITVANKHRPQYPNSTMAFDPPYLYIGRPSALGNQFVIGKDGTRAEVVEKYRVWLKEAYYANDKVKTEIDIIRNHHLAGTNVTLVCWCKPAACHGDVIKEFVESMQ